MFLGANGFSPTHEWPLDRCRGLMRLEGSFRALSTFTRLDFLLDSPSTCLYFTALWHVVCEMCLQLSASLCTCVHTMDEWSSFVTWNPFHLCCVMWHVFLFSGAFKSKSMLYSAAQLSWRPNEKLNGRNSSLYVCIFWITNIFMRH